MQDFLDHMQTGFPVVLAWLGANWLELLKALAPIGTLLVAWSALQNWRKQDKARREADFLDSLLDAVHGFVAVIGPAVVIVQYIRLSIDSYVDVENDEDAKRAGVVKFILAAGTDYSTMLGNALTPARAATVALRSLAAKGHVFNFPGYRDCHIAIGMMTAEYERLDSIAAMLKNKTLNWGNPAATVILDLIGNVDAQAIQTDIQTLNAQLIVYANGVYTDLYGIKKKKAGHPKMPGS